MKKLLAAAFLLATSSAHATLIKWTLEDVRMQYESYAGSMEGYFIYDTQLPFNERFLEVNIRVQDDFGTDELYTSVGVALLESTQFLTKDGPITVGDPVMQLTYIFDGSFPDIVLDTPGTVLLDTYATNPYRQPFTWYAHCNVVSVNNNRRCTNISSGLPVQTGQIVGTVVPVPAAFWLFVSAISGLGLLRSSHRPITR